MTAPGCWQRPWRPSQLLLAGEVFISQHLAEWSWGRGRTECRGVGSVVRGARSFLRHLHPHLGSLARNSTVCRETGN